jgi:hypothetical protein
MRLMIVIWLSMAIMLTYVRGITIVLFDIIIGNAVHDRLLSQPKMDNYLQKHDVLGACARLSSSVW